MTQIPKIVKSGLSDTWYVMTRYRTKHGLDETGRPVAYYVAQTKYDVTDQMKAILHSHKPKRRRPGADQP
jgi:hypothetical protein